MDVLPSMNAGASTSAVPSRIEGLGTAWVLLGSWVWSPARPTPIHPRHERRGFSALLVMYLGKIVEMAAADALFTRPGHPYTQALLSAAPSAKPGITKVRILLNGDVPSPLNPPGGCRFHTRCPKAMRQCKIEEPRWQEGGKEHYTACHLYT